jgi:hypothetical protein
VKLGKKKFHPRYIAPNPLDGVEIPNWGSVYEFMVWWFENGSPLMFPDNRVICSDDATSISLFRCGQFQVELYLVFPNPNLPIHEHPDVEVIKMRTDSWAYKGGEFVNTTKQQSSQTLKNGQSHGAGRNFKETNGIDTGFGLLAFQKWKDGLEVTTVASRWKGKTVGPKQEELIRKLSPDAIVVDGYADTTGVS